MKKAVAVISLIIGIIILCTGCADIISKIMGLSTPVLDPVIPVGGGVVSGDGKADEYSFTPGNTGIWTFEVTEEGDGGFTLEITHPDGLVSTGSGYNGFYLLEGTTYKIIMGVWTYSAGYKNSYILTVSPADIIPGSGGELYVNRNTIYSFKPDRTEIWTFQTQSSDNEPFINIKDVINSEPIAYNKKGTDDGNAFITVELKEEITYMIEVGCFSVNFEGFTLTVKSAD